MIASRHRGVHRTTAAESEVYTSGDKQIAASEAQDEQSNHENGEEC